MTDYLDLTTEANLIPTLVASETLGALRSNMALLGLVTRDYEDEIAEEGQTVQVGERGALSVNPKGEGSDVTVQAPTSTKHDVTLDTHEEVTIGQEDIAKMLESPKDQVEGYGEDASIALLESIEASLAGLYSGFSNTIDATTGIGEDTFREARRILNSAKAPIRGRWAVVHEDAEYEILGIERVINQDYAQALNSRMDASRFSGQHGGFDIFLDQNIVVATSEAKNIFGHANAMALATRPMRETQLPNVIQRTMNENGIGLRVTLWYNPNALAEQMTIDVLYGVAELRDSHAVVVSSSEI